MKAIMTVGVSASGKSTWAKSTNMISIDRDNIRKKILLTKSKKYQEQKDNMWRYWRFEWENEVDDHIAQELDTHSKYKNDIIICATHLNTKKRNDTINKLNELGYEVELKYFPIDYIEAIRRDNKRPDSVGETVINNQWYQWLQLPREDIGIPKYIKDHSKPKTLLVDIDGTVAKMVTRHPYDWARVIEDQPIMEIIELIWRYPDYELIFMTGRDEVCRAQTVEWLNRYFVREYVLYMREAGTYIRDDIIKSKLFWEHIADHYCVELVIDDRHMVCRLWEDMGLKLLNVGSFYNIF